MPGEDGFRIHRDKPNDMSNEPIVKIEAEGEGNVTWPMAAIFIAFMAMMGWLGWVWWG